MENKWKNVRKMKELCYLEIIKKGVIKLLIFMSKKWIKNCENWKKKLKIDGVMNNINYAKWWFDKNRRIERLTFWYHI